MRKAREHGFARAARESQTPRRSVDAPDLRSGPEPLNPLFEQGRSAPGNPQGGPMSDSARGHGAWPMPASRPGAAVIGRAVVLGMVSTGPSRSRRAGLTEEAPSDAHLEKVV